MILGRSNDLFGMGSNSEDNLKLRVQRDESQEILEANMYKEAAKRVVFENCFNACELTNKLVPHFGRHFYYNQPKEQACLQECFNARIGLHFGSLALEE
jgi:hypothetical protein